MSRAVQWLNEHSDLTVWLFQVETLKIAEGRVAPLLRHIVGPSVYSRQARAENRADATDASARQEFWAVVLPKARAACSQWALWQRHKPTPHAFTYHVVPNCPGKIGWEMQVTSRGSWACLRIEAPSGPDEAEYYGSQILNHRQAIEAAFGSDLKWKFDANQKSKVLRWDNPNRGGYRDDSSSWEPAAESLAEGVARLVAATIEPLRSLTPYQGPRALYDAENERGTATPDAVS